MDRYWLSYASHASTETHSSQTLLLPGESRKTRQNVGNGGDVDKWKGSVLLTSHRFALSIALDGHLEHFGMSDQVLCCRSQIPITDWLEKKCI